MSIDKIQGTIGSLKQLNPAQQAGQVTDSGEAKKGNFADVLKDTMKEVNQLQLTAEDRIESFVMGRGAITPHNAMIALEKADIAFQLMNTIRSRIIRAYEEVMRTQV